MGRKRILGCKGSVFRELLRSKGRRLISVEEEEVFLNYFIKYVKNIFLVGGEIKEVVEKVEFNRKRIVVVKVVKVS